MTVSNELIDSLLANYKKPEDLIGEYGILKQQAVRRCIVQVAQMLRG